MKTTTPTRVALTFAVAAGLFTSACASPTVAEREGRSATPAANAESLIPQGIGGDVLADARKRVADSLGGTSGFTPPTQPVPGQRTGGTIAFVAADLTNGGVNTVSQAVVEAA